MAVTMDGKSKPHTNGSPKGSRGINGINGVNGANGMNGMNGMNGTNGHAVVSRRSTPIPKKKGFFAWTFNIVARLLTWYSIYTILFRCPTGHEACDESSPRICKPYFQVKSAVSPHLTPYYDTYAAPYVDIAKPYYDTVDRVVITPGRTYAVKYGGPRVSQAKVYSQAQWEKNVQPQLHKYQTLAKAKYDESVSPHVEKASNVVAPYYDVARTNALQTYHDLLLPSYLFVQPYAAHGYDVAYNFTADTAVPTTVWAWNKTYVFLDSTVWPHLRDVYVLKVEPQLVRIGERLGRYNEKKSQSVVEDVDSSTTKSTFAKPSSSVSSAISSASSVVAGTAEAEPSSSVVDDSETPDASPEVKIDTKKSKGTPQEIRAQAAKTVAEDLELWQGKFSQAADEGAVEIEERVDEISARMIQQHANVSGKALVRDLDETATSELANLKKSIIDILEKQGGDPEKRDEELANAVRGAGLKIKDKAQGIRKWRQNYERETENAVTDAAREHFSILDKTRDLALQKLGMKWAWMDGVTYQDWKKYHALRAQFAEWTQDLKRLITTHPGLLAAQSAGVDVEDEAMGIAQAAAEELGRLKQVAAWKAIAGDSSYDFDSNTMELAAQAAHKKMAEAAEKVESGAESVGGVLSESASSAISSGSETTALVDSEKTETVVVSLSPADAEDSDTSALPPMESMAAEPTESASDLASDSSETQVPGDESTNAAEPVEPLPTSEPVDGPDQIEEMIVETPDEPTQSVEEAASTTIKSALFGAAAQSVPSRQPIMDDDFSSSASSAISVVQDVPASITEAAQSAYTAAIAGAADQYSRAMSAVSVQISGEPKPVHEEMLSSVSNAYFGAMASANSQLGAAMTAASEGVYGTPTTKWMPDMPTMPSVPSVEWEKVQSIAQQNLQNSVDWASEQYEAAKVAVGAAEPTPSSYLEGAEKKAEMLLDQAKHNYFAGLGLAHARYSEFLSAASTAASSLTATPTPTNIQESASSVASVAGDSVAAAASAASEAAESVASSVGAMASDASDSVGENWDSLVSQVSSQVYGAPTPTPWYQNLYDSAGDYASAAGEYAASATDAAGDQVSAASSAAGDYASSAGDAASSQYSVVSSLVSELVHGKEPSFTESVFSRLGGAYATGASSASSYASAASASVVSAASEVTDSAESMVDAAGDTVSSMAEKVKETVDHMKDEL